MTDRAAGRDGIHGLQWEVYDTAVNGSTYLVNNMWQCRPGCSMVIAVREIK